MVSQSEQGPRQGAEIIITEYGQSFPLFKDTKIRQLTSDELKAAYNSPDITPVARTAVGIKMASSKPFYANFELIIANQKIMDEVLKRSRESALSETIMYVGDEYVIRGVGNRFISTPLKDYGSAGHGLSRSNRLSRAREVDQTPLTVRASFYTNNEEERKLLESAEFGLKIGDRRYYLNADEMHQMSEGPTVVQEKVRGKSLGDKVILLPYQSQIITEFSASFLTRTSLLQ